MQELGPSGSTTHAATSVALACRLQPDGRGDAPLQRTGKDLRRICDFSPLPAYAPPTEPTPLEGEMAVVARELEKNIAGMDAELRDLSVKMWDLHELGWKEL